MADSPSLKSDIYTIIKWSIATPVLAIWMLVSIFPLFGLFASEKTVLAVMFNLVFLATGFYALAGGLAIARASAVDPEARKTVMTAVRGSGLKLAVYAALWLTAYGLYGVFIA